MSFARLLSASLALCACAHAPDPAPSPATAGTGPSLLGAWQGAITIPRQDIGVELRVTGDDAALLEVRAQGLHALPVTVSRPTADTVLLTATLPGDQAVRFEGSVKGERIEGHYFQGGHRLPFWFQRGAHAAPRVEVAGDGFRELPASFDNGPVHLEGTLTVPAAAATAVPVAVLVAGSGPHDRDENLFGFKVFAQLAQALARAGIATLRYDDRGVGESTGTFDGATTADFSTDAEAAVAFLRTRTEVDPARIGIIGHSEGGLVAPMVAARNRSVAFVVLLAGPGQPIDELMVEQTRLVLQREGAAQAEVDQAVAQQRQAMSLLKSGQDLSSLSAQLAARCPQPCKSPDEFVKQQRALSESPWFRSFVAYDPRPTLTKVRCPVLALGGSLDVQVPSAVNLPLIDKALAEGGNAQVAIQEIAGMNHVLQAAKTGAVSEYVKLAQRLEPSLVGRISTWVLALHTDAVAQQRPRP